MIGRGGLLWPYLIGLALGLVTGYALWQPEDAVDCRLHRAAEAAPAGLVRVEPGDPRACLNLLGWDMWGTVDGGRLTPLVAAAALGLAGLLVAHVATLRARYPRTA